MPKRQDLKSILIIGAGPLGLLHAGVARSLGASTILFSEIDVRRRQQLVPTVRRRGRLQWGCDNRHALAQHRLPVHFRAQQAVRESRRLWLRSRSRDSR